jgi:hypothetical protein
MMKREREKEVTHHALVLKLYTMPFLTTAKDPDPRGAAVVSSKIWSGVSDIFAPILPP